MEEEGQQFLEQANKTTKRIGFNNKLQTEISELKGMLDVKESEVRKYQEELGRAETIIEELEKRRDLELQVGITSLQKTMGVVDERVVDQGEVEGDLKRQVEESEIREEEYRQRVLAEEAKNSYLQQSLEEVKNGKEREEERVGELVKALEAVSLQMSDMKGEIADMSASNNTKDVVIERLRSDNNTLKDEIVGMKLSETTFEDASTQTEKKEEEGEKDKATQERVKGRRGGPSAR